MTRLLHALARPLRATPTALRAIAAAALVTGSLVPVAQAQSTAHAAVPRHLAAPAAEATAPYVRHLADLINAYRASHGLAPLSLTQDLSAIATEHSAQMAGTRRLSHEGFRERFDRTRAQICVENVGVNFPHPEAQLDGWRASPGHHRNLLEPKVARMGIATTNRFVTFFACS